MKRILASVGLMAVGVSALQAQYAPGLSDIERSKPWSVSASLRGFYDDNFTTTYKPTDSFGVDFSPSVSFNHSAENTLLKASYVYDIKNYEHGGVTDQTHQLNGTFDHAFSERYKLALSESFVIGQEPEVLSGSEPTATPVRLNGSNIRNTATADFLAQVTPLLGLEMTYGNTLYSYNNSAYATILDRMEQTVELDTRWHVLQQTTAIFGYRFGAYDYTSSSILGFTPAGEPITSSFRNSYSHIITFGVDQVFTPELTGSLRVGPEFADYYNEGDSSVNPYVDASLGYVYAKDCSLRVGIRQTRNASDQLGLVGSNNAVLDETSTAPYASITHKITPKLTGGLMVQWQHSVIKSSGSSALNNATEDFIIGNLNFSYQFNPYLSAETGYDLSNLTSDFSFRGYKRNDVYLGVRATY